MGRYRKRSIIGLATVWLLACGGISQAAEPDRLKLPDFDLTLPAPAGVPTASDPSPDAQQVVVPVPTSAATGLVLLTALGVVGLRKPLVRFFS
jgi:hypothetical protein